TAQADLLRYIDERLSPDHQVLYTTHSPFMVQADHLERARLVEDVDKVGTTVRDDALGTTEETQFPLHAAIGMQVTQTLFVGPATLIVEGNADLLYLQTMSRVLADEGRTGLDDRWTVLPVGGLDKMPTFMALLSPQVYVVAVHDSTSKAPQRLKSLVDSGVIVADQLVPLAEIVDEKEADIEDLFGADAYLTIVNDSGTAVVSTDDLRGSGRIVPRIERGIGRSFSHYAPARYLASRPEVTASELGEVSLDRFEALFLRVNKLLGSARAR
ncbi:MAG: hypothetical protein WBF71_14605, partial [Microthrixaceae bacterium]